MLAIEMHSQGGARVIEASGELAGAASRQLRRAMNSELNDGGKRFVLRLDGITGCDIGGLREIYFALKRARRAGGDLCLAMPSDSMREGLAASRLAEILRVYESLDEAAASFRDRV